MNTSRVTRLQTVGYANGKSTLIATLDMLRQQAQIRKLKNPKTQHTIRKQKV